MIWWEILIYVVAVGLGIFVGMLLTKWPFAKKPKEQFLSNLQMPLPILANEEEKAKEQTGWLGSKEKPSVVEKAGQEAQTTIEENIAELYRGDVQLSVLPPVGVEQVKLFEEYLKQIADCRLLIVGGSEAGPFFRLSLETPLNLGDQLREIPIVDEVIEHGKKIGIILK